MDKTTTWPRLLTWTIKETLIIAGEFKSTADFDPGSGTQNLTAGSLADLFVVKLNAAGTFVWVKGFYGNRTKGAKVVVTDLDNNVFLAGYFYGVIDADPSVGTFNLTANSFARDGFIIKLDGAGALLWATNIGGGQDDIVNDVSVDNLGNVYAIGDFGGTVDFDPSAGVSNMTSTGVEDIFIWKLTASGSFLWAKKMGAAFYINYGFGIHVDPFRNIYTTGHFWGQVDFDPEAGISYLKMVDVGDFYIQKLSQCQNVTRSILNAFACDTFKLNTIPYTVTGTYTQAIRNTAGCDSIITLNLTIGKKTTTQSLSACNAYTWNGRVYQNTGSYWDTLLTTKGCDSLVNLLLTIKKPVNNTISTTICEGQSRDGYAVAGTYVDTFLSVNGCDSIRTLHLFVQPKKSTSVSLTICGGENYFGHSQSGTYTDTFQTVFGCDSIRTLNLVVLPVKHTIVDTSICQGEAVFLAGNFQGVPGIYRDTFRSITGCDSIVVTTLRVKAKPVFSLGPDRSLCDMDSIVLDPGVHGQYLWSNHSTLAIQVVKDTGLYWLGVTASNGCMYSDSVRIINRYPLPQGFLVQLDSLCAMGNVRLHSRQSFRSYLWSSGSLQPDITITRAGLYRLEVIDVNGCKGIDSILVTEKDCLTKVYVPSAFTPNNDQKNDVLKPVVTGVVKGFSFSVYNRWGQLVFKSTDPKKGWDGKVNGLQQHTATFVWVCEYTDNLNQRKWIKGVSTLVE